MSTVKHQLYEQCYAYIATEIAAAQRAIDDAREAVANETKSSAGDKYETSREMMQQEINLNTTRLGELQRSKAALDTISPEQCGAVIGNGSVIHTSQGSYYLAISIGKVVIDGTTYYTLSAASPLGSRLTGLKSRDAFIFNGKEIRIIGVL